jgi:serine/threonine-protein kinase
VEDRIAAAIVAALRPRIEATPPSAIPKPATAEAYDSYLRGRYLRRQMTADGIEKSVAFFEDAIRRDKRYAPAYAALADADAMLGFHGLAPPDEVVPKAREAARQALALDAANAQAHGALGWIAFTYDRNWPAAETEFRLAVQTDRNWPNVRQWFAFGLVARGRFDEAVAQSQKALDLEPLSFITGNDMSSVLYFARRYSESMRNARRGLELDVHASQPHVLIGACLTDLGRPTEAVAEFRQAIDPANPWTDEDLMGRLGYAYARSGRRAEALELLDRLSGRPAGATASAFIQLGLGEKEKALGLLAQACDRKEGDTLFLKVEPLADPLRGDPRFVALLRKIGY